MTSEPLSSSADLSSVGYRGDQLAAMPAVAAALERYPAELITLAEPDEDPLSRDRLCAQLYVGTDGGTQWSVSFGDEVGYLVQPSRGALPEDLLENALAGQPHVESVYHYDREAFEVRTTRVVRADEMLAHWLDAILTAHRAYARHLGRELPY